MKKIIVQCFVISVILVLPTYSYSSWLSEAVNGVAGAIGNVSAKVFGFERANDQVRENIDHANEKAREILSVLDLIAEKRIDQGDDVVKKRLEQLGDIFTELDSNVGKNISELERATDSTLKKLDKLKNDTVKDIDRIFEKIFGVLNEAECIVMGQVMSVEMVGNKLLTEAGKKLDLKKKIVAAFKSILKRDDESGEKPAQPQSIRPANYYESMKKILQSEMTENTPVKDILSIYADLSFLSRRMVCLHRNSEAQELYTRDFLKFEVKLKLWKSVYYSE